MNIPLPATPGGDRPARLAVSLFKQDRSGLTSAQPGFGLVSLSNEPICAAMRIDDRGGEA
jgi:hypothetical protein